LTNLAQSLLQQQAQEKGHELDISDVRVFKVIQHDVDGDGQEEVCFVAGFYHPWALTGICLLLDPSQDGYRVVTLLSFMDGFRELQVSDINNDGIPEIIVLQQSGSGGFLTLHIFQWDGTTLKSLFPERDFYQGFYETKDLDVDSVDEVVIWQGEWKEPNRWEPKRFDVFVFGYNNQLCRYELQFSRGTERLYSPGDIVQRSYGGLIGLPLEAGQRAIAVDEYRKQLEVFIQNQQVDEDFVNKLVNHQTVLVEEGSYKEALEITDLTLEAAKYLPDPTIRTRFLIILSRERGKICSLLGDYSNAVNSYVQSLSFWTDDISIDFSAYPAYLHAGFHRELGMMYSAIGDYEHTLTLLFTAQTLLESVDLSVSENLAELSRLHSNFGLTYARLGEADLTISSFKEAIALDKKLGNNFGLVINYMGLGNVQRAIKSYQEAIQSYQAALKVLDEISHRDRESDVYLELGLTLILNRQLEEGLQYLHKALLLTSVGNLKQREAIHYLYLGEAYRQFGNLQLAAQFFQKAIAFAQEFDTPETEWQALYGLALSYQRQGQQQKCQQALEDAIDTIEKLRSQYLPETFKISLFAEKTKPYEAMVLLCHSTSPDQAFDFMERAKSRIFIEQLATTAMGSVAGIPSELAEQEAQLIGELRCLQLRHRETLSQQKYEWGDEIIQIESNLEQLWHDIRRASAKGAEYVALRQATPLDFTGVKQIVNAL
jgi:tetratricopeptide (TPR) repeat protein